MSGTNRFLKWLKRIAIGLLLFFITLFIAVWLVLKNDKVQTYVVSKITNYLHEEFGFNVKIKSVDIEPIKFIVLKEVEILDHHSKKMILVEKIRCDITSFDQKEVLINLDQLDLKNPVVRLIKYKGEEDYNLIHAINQIPSSTSEGDSKYKVKLDQLLLKNVLFELRDDNVLPNDSLFVDYNHLLLENGQIKIKDILIQPDNIRLKLNELSFNSKTKLGAFSLSAAYENHLSKHKLKNFKVTVGKSKIHTEGLLSLDLSAKSLAEMVQLDWTSLDGVIDASQIGQFTGQLFKWEEEISLKGRLSGNLDSLNLSQMDISTQHGLVLTSKGLISHLTDSVPLQFNLDLSKAYCSNATWLYYKEALRLEGMEVVDEYFQKLKFVQLSGFIDASLDQGISHQLNVQTGIGSLYSKNKLELNDGLSFKGMVSQLHFDVGKLLSQMDLGQVKGDVEYQFNWKNELNGQYKLHIASVEYMKYLYHEITAEGSVQGTQIKNELRINDKHLQLNQSLVLVTSPVIEVQTTGAISNCYASKLKLLDRGEQLNITGRFSGQFKGNDLDDLQGKLSLSDFRWQEGFYDYELAHFDLEASQKQNKNLYVIKSDWLDLKMQGEFLFSDLSDIATTIVDKQFSNVLKMDVPSKIEPNVSCQIDLDYHYILPVNRLFFPDINIERVRLYGKIDGSQEKMVDLKSEIYGLKYDFKKVEDFTISLSGGHESLDLGVKASKVTFTDTLNIKNFSFKVKNTPNQSNVRLGWRNNDTLLSSANIGINVDWVNQDSLTFKFDPNSKVWLDSLKWQFRTDDVVSISPSRFYIPGMSISNGKQRFDFKGIVGPTEKDVLAMEFKQVDLETLMPLYHSSGFSFDGILNGKIKLIAITEKIRSEANFLVERFKVNEVPLGDFEFVTNYNHQNKRIEMSSYIGKKDRLKFIDFNAEYFPFETDDQFNGKLVIDKLPVRIINRMLAGTASFGGAVNGVLDFYGSIDSPKFKGELEARGANVNIAYLGKQSYTFLDDKIKLNEKGIKFKQFGLTDINQQKSFINGEITYDFFRDMEFNLSVGMDKFLVLNTTRVENETFYGTAVSTGKVDITGNTSMMMFNVKAKTDRLVSKTLADKKEFVTVINIPLDAKSQAEQSDFITFIKKNKVIEVKQEEKENETSMGMLMNFEFDVNETAEVNLIFDSKVGDAIRARGNSKLRVFINDYGDMSIYGDYTVSEGDYLFTLQNFINKKFILKPGGTVKWTGDPYAAVINVETYYQTTTDVSDFLLSSSSSQKVKANCLLAMKGDMMAPDITMDLDFPDASETVKSELRNSLDTEKKVIDQFFNLMIFNRMIPDNSSNKIGVGEGISKSTGEMIEAQLDYWLSQFSEKVKLGFNSESLGESLGSEYNVEFERKLGDKLNLTGNVGWTTSGSNENQSDNKHLAGDVALQYELTKEVDLTFFDRGNETDLTKENTRTQGVGVKYETSFDEWKELKEPLEDLKTLIKRIKMVKGNYTR